MNTIEKMGQVGKLGDMLANLTKRERFYVLLNMWEREAETSEELMRIRSLKSSLDGVLTSQERRALGNYFEQTCVPTYDC